MRVHAGRRSITDLDLNTISLLSGLEDLNLGVGVSLGKTGVPVGAGNCRVTGGIQLTDLGVAKLAKLTRLRRLDISGAKITPAGLSALKKLPQARKIEPVELHGAERFGSPGAGGLAEAGQHRSLVHSGWRRDTEGSSRPCRI